jgi:DNA-binding HxlR family transcriptional regulator
MTNQAYGQYCGLARALEVVGEPWAMLVVRDLMVAPKTPDELLEGLPKMSGDALSARLEELEHAGVIRRRAAFEPRATARYELTEYGSELEDIVLQLARWGARTMGGPRRDEIVTAESMVMALRTVFRPEAARRLRASYVIEAGDISIYARVDHGTVEVGQGSLPDPDLIIEAGPALRSLLSGEMSPREAMESDGVRLRAGDAGLAADPGLLAWFVEAFRIPPAPPARVSGDGHMLGLAARINDHVVGVGSWGHAATRFTGA